jgi:hypothetical protein
MVIKILGILFKVIIAGLILVGLYYAYQYVPKLWN